MTLPQRVAHIIRHGMSVLHPCVYGELGSVRAARDLADDLRREIALLCPDRDPNEVVGAFVARIDDVRRLVETDIDAAYDGDPAATSRMEVVMSYPGVYAVTIHRLAHELYTLKVPVIPRVMSELAHSKTGIDIHPGATIGRYFFIDHGTGIVVGETTVIGDYVKIYQGVTLGALSTRKGQALSGVKRHPTLKNRVTVYSGASILGGDTVIGDDCIIGGNAFVTSSVPDRTRVSVESPSLTFRELSKTIWEKA